MVRDAVGWGALNFDYTYLVDRLATGDQQVVISDTHGAPGGSVANTINGLAILGVPTGFIGALGDDLEGQKILKQMQDVGIDTSRIQKLASVNTSRVMVFVDSKGERAMYTLPGAGVSYRPDEGDIKYLRASKYTIISAIPGENQLRIMQDAVEKVYEKSRVIFMPGALYTRYGFSKLKDIITRSYLLILNRREAQALTGVDHRNAGNWLIVHGANFVVITLGKDGCQICDKETSAAVPTPVLPQKSIIDSTGAGDAFTAGLVYGLLHGKTKIEAALYGNLAARACLQGLGARTGLANEQTLELDFKRFSDMINGGRNMAEVSEGLAPQTMLKKQAGEKAAEYVKDGMVVGLGTGSTVKWTIRKLGSMVKEGMEIIGIPTSIRSENLAIDLGIPLSTLIEHPMIDVTIDGADEVDPKFNLIKGLGGALTREKIVAANSKKEIIVVDDSKLVDTLGTKAPVPVEVIQFAWNTCKNQLTRLQCEPVLRMVEQNRYVTDNNNYILDCRFSGIPSPDELELQINNIPGVIENGLFLHLTDMVVVASAQGVSVLTSG
ncbi:ribose-5-phosphate isomerase RpiA [[Eubacterium] cellulosolvens]